jgi:hypothetical protein
LIVSAKILVVIARIEVYNMKEPDFDVGNIQLTTG